MAAAVAEVEFFIGLTMSGVFVRVGMGRLWITTKAWSGAAATERIAPNMLTADKGSCVAEGIREIVIRGQPMGKDRRRLRALRSTVPGRSTAANHCS